MFADDFHFKRLAALVQILLLRLSCKLDAQHFPVSRLLGLESLEAISHLTAGISFAAALGGLVVGLPADDLGVVVRDDEAFHLVLHFHLEFDGLDAFELAEKRFLKLHVRLGVAERRRVLKHVRVVDIYYLLVVDVLLEDLDGWGARLQSRYL